MMQKQQITLIIFFSNIVKNLEIPKYEVEDDLHLDMNSHSTLKKPSKYPSGVFVIKFQILIFLASIKIQF